MVRDTLSGRSPLYRLADFFKHQDTELLLGRQLADSVCNDTSAGRAMDAIFEVGAGKLFGEVACQACRPSDRQIRCDMSPDYAPD
jgi:hypothetical protein